MTTIRLTAAQAMVRWLSVQHDRGRRAASSKASGRSSATATSRAWARRCTRIARRAAHLARPERTDHGPCRHRLCQGARAGGEAMAVTSSIGPGATNMVTAAALAHVNRLPVLFIPGDVFANRAPDPVLQQIEDFDDGTVIGQRLLPPRRPLLRPDHAARAHPDRPAPRPARDDRPGGLRPGLPRLLPGRAGRGLRLSRRASSSPAIWHIRRPEPDQRELEAAVAAIRAAKTPADRGGRRRALFRRRGRRLLAFAETHNIPRRRNPGRQVARWTGSTRSTSARPASPAPACGNELAARGRPGDRRRHAVPGLHHRLLDAVHEPGPQASVDQRPRLRRPQARRAAALSPMPRSRWRSYRRSPRQPPLRRPPTSPPRDRLVRRPPTPSPPRPTGQRAAHRRAGDRRGAAHRRQAHHRHVRRRHHAGRAARALATRPQGGYHMEYGFSCMGYEIAGAHGHQDGRSPTRDVICMVGDGSYMMANSRTRDRRDDGRRPSPSS